MRGTPTTFWGKLNQDDEGKITSWHPLVLHMLDVAASADAILALEPEATRKKMASGLGMAWEDARPWILLLVACHDLGKACPGFQTKWPGFAQLQSLAIPPSPNTKINHGFVSQIALRDSLCQLDWPEDLADLAADAVGCHHGSRASPDTLYHLEGDARAIGREDWASARRSLFDAVLAVLKPSCTPVKKTLDGPDFMLLSGLTSFADWIGSNEDWFTAGTVEDCADLRSWFAKRRRLAGRALEGIGWTPRTPISQAHQSFEDVFDLTPRPLQQTVAEALADLDQPAILLVEAPMGEGKTEAAFYAHLELQRQLGHRGLYVALPTKATGNAMFKRTLKFLRDQGTGRTLDLQLLHGSTFLNDTFQDLCISGIHDSVTGGEIRAAEWFTPKKRALLSEYGVGTVDQALLPILPVKHHFVRLWGLANRVVVFDEIHAYDAYTGTLLFNLIRWLLALGSSVVLLSATLSPSIRRRLAGVVGAYLPDQEEEYPRLSIFQPRLVKQTHFDADPARRLTVRVQGIGEDLSSIYASIEKHLTGGGMGLALVNTVQRAQDLYGLFPEGDPLEHDGQRVGKRLSDGTEVFLFHARFPAEQRQRREDQALKLFGKGGCRNGRRILVATQVVEQSLDLDFDLIATDLAPIDLVLQRAGRLWRHQENTRPFAEPMLMIAGLDGDEPPPFGNPLWWGAVYNEALLLRTWCLLRPRQSLTIPDEIDVLVQAVYEDDEDQADVPESLLERLEQALEVAEGDAMAFRTCAHQAIIGLPDDSSWNQPERFVLYDEEEPGVHRTLMARTRLGEDSVVAIPLWPQDEFSPEDKPDSTTAKQWFLRALSLSKKRIVSKLQARGVPEGWKRSAMLRNCIPLVLDQNSCWVEDPAVRLDDDLGLVCEPKEVE